jgi:hypothetical protein
LYKWYSAADLGIWPLQESISMVEAASCSLSFICSDKMSATKRLRNNNALLYKE